MKRRLFLTGPIGCGKSTAIAQALGHNITRCGGFLTRRYREPALHFTVESPDGKQKKTFLDFSAGTPEPRLAVFSDFCLQADVLLLDEIGGIELLDPAFAASLEQVLKSDVPILGVIKGEGPASSLIRTLGLTAEYENAAGKLRQQLRSDCHTQVYECSKYDKNALLLARQWVEEYLP